MAHYRNSYSLEIRHEGLKKYRMICGSDEYVIRQKAQAQLAQWDEMWNRKQIANAAREEREMRQQKKELAKEYTDRAQRAIAALHRILADTLDVNDAIDWNTLLDKRPFPKPHPSPFQGIAPVRKPEPTDPEYNPTKHWYHYLLDDMWKKIKKQSARKYRDAASDWELQMEQIAQANKKSRAIWEEEVQAWRRQRDQFIAEQHQKNDHIKSRQEAYLRGDPEAIMEYHDLVLSKSTYPDYFPQQWELDYISETKTLVVEYVLPPPDSLPATARVDYVAKHDDLRDVPLKPSEFDKLYDSILHQICLRTIHENFEADQIGVLEYVVFNGIVSSVSQATGNLVTCCVMSLRAQREQFQKINLAEVDPKACFKNH